MSEHVTALYFTAAVFGVWWLFFVEYRSYLVAQARQDLFAVRDAFFSAAERGDLPFNSAAYTMTRDMLNGSIRFAHRITLIRVLGIIVAHALVKGQKARPRFSKEYDAARHELNDVGRKAVDNAHRSMHVILIRYLVFRSLFLLTINMTTFLFVSMRESIKRRLLRTKKWSVIDKEIKDVGEGHGDCDDEVVHA